jgi:hypothetical protein
MWLSADPAMGEYVPQAPINDDIRKQNQNLPGMGGVFNYVNLHAYHYAGNNPVKLTDPDGRQSRKDADLDNAVNEAFQFYLKTRDPSLEKADRDMKMYIEDQATMGRIPSQEEIQKHAEQAIFGQMIYEMVGAFAVALTQMPVSADSATNSSSNVSNARSLNNPNSLRGATRNEVERLIPKDWIALPLKKGEGMRFIDPRNHGNAIFIEQGIPGASGVHGGPYVKTALNGRVERIPLAGNPILNSLK